jgi:hypothetical protein
MNNYLSCVPNLKQFNVHLSIFDSVIYYNLFVLIIDDCLPLLKRFYFYVYFFNLIEFCEYEIASMINRMKEKFSIVHNNRYQSRLFIR